MKNLEEREQCGLIEWAKLNMKKYPELELLHAIPNGGSRSTIEGARLKRQGVKPGMPDLCLPVGRGGYHALYIEMKHSKGKVSPVQHDVHRILLAFGNRVAVCYSAKEAASEILEYLALT